MSSTQSTQNPNQQPPPAAQPHPSPLDNDADDLDDLDDVLDEFNKPQPSSFPQPPRSQPPLPPQPAAASHDDGDADADGLDDLLSKDLAHELARGMEALMKELGQSSSSATAGAASTAQTGAGADALGASGSAVADEPQFSEEDLMKQFEAMMAGFSQQPPAAAQASTSQGKARKTAAPAQPANFNDALKATMARLKESDASATASNSSAADPFAALGGAGGDDMAKLLAALGGEGGDNGFDNPELAKMLEGMMDELMSKEILYEPLKELKDKYPAYLQGPESAKDSVEDRTRYEAQAKYVAEIVALFEDPKYDAENKETTARIQDLMNQMQDCGSPPQQIVGDMPAELENIPGFGGDNGECTVM
ncbi:Peroxisome chaperone and import receptor [Thecaphora frezii]